ncbi:hypothetical protein ACIA8G_19835 [Lentzea sp. NPDC051213]|uniref:hypothetical protein n=1 Tax=Lentzea sp. NPDC051213 TaxID=3364126 RepID=UPI0037B16502
MPGHVLAKQTTTSLNLGDPTAQARPRAVLDPRRPAYPALKPAEQDSETPTAPRHR